MKNILSALQAAHLFIQDRLDPEAPCVLTLLRAALDETEDYELERAVVEAAIARRETERTLFPRGAPNSGDSLLNEQFVAEQKAVDALIEARKEK